MNRAYWLICLVPLLAGCGGSSRGWTVSVVTPGDRPIPGAQISLVPLPPGGPRELQELVARGEQLWGWHYTTDKKGGARLKGMPTGGLVVAGYTPPQVYSYQGGTQGRSNSYAYGSSGNSAYGHGRYSSTTRGTLTTPGQVSYQYAPGAPLGIVVQAPGHRPYIGSVTFTMPKGKLGKIRVETRSGLAPEINRHGGVLALEAE